MPPVLPTGQIPPGACGQVRPVGATLPTAARRAPSREAADGYTCPHAGQQSHRETRHSRTAESCHRDRPQRHLRGQVQKLDLPGGNGAGHILQPQEPECPGRHFLKHP